MRAHQPGQLQPGIDHDFDPEFADATYVEPTLDVLQKVIAVEQASCPRGQTGR